MITAKKLEINEELYDTFIVKFNGKKAKRLRESSCRHVFIGDDFVVKIDSPQVELGNQCENEALYYSRLEELGLLHIAPKLLDSGVISVKIDGYYTDVHYVVQEKIEGRIPSDDELIKFKVGLKEIHGIITEDLTEYNALIDDHGKFYMIDFGIESF